MSDSQKKDIGRRDGIIIGIELGQSKKWETAFACETSGPVRPPSPPPP